MTSSFSTISLGRSQISPPTINPLPTTSPASTASPPSTKISTALSESALERFAVARKFRGGMQLLPQELWEKILWQVHIGDIVEVFMDYTEDWPRTVQTSCSPSADFLDHLLQNENSSTSPPIFKSFTTSPFNGQTYFDDKHSVLFFSPLMPAECIDKFTNELEEEERARFRRIAINQFTLPQVLDVVGDIDDSFHLPILAKYPNLEELIAVSEIPEEKNPPLGPTKEPPQKVQFFPARSNKSREKEPIDSNDVRRVLETKLDEIREEMKAWPRQRVRVDVVYITRDGKLIETAHPTDHHLDLQTRLERRIEEDVERGMKEWERKEENDRTVEEILEGFAVGDGDMDENGDADEPVYDSDEQHEEEGMGVSQLTIEDGSDEEKDASGDEVES